jgi:hypothetical protein
MKKVVFSILTMGSFLMSNAQASLDTSNAGNSTIISDSRLETLEDKMTDYNKSIAAANSNTTTIVTKSGEKEVTKTTVSGIVLTNGYRLMVISTPDRDLAMRVRARLFQTFPDQKPYMEFQMPNTKIKFGNFLDRGQADRVRKQIMAMKLVPNNIYVVPCLVEMKVQKTVETAVDPDKVEKKSIEKKKVEKKKVEKKKTEKKKEVKSK